MSIKALFFLLKRVGAVICDYVTLALLGLAALVLGWYLARIIRQGRKARREAMGYLKEK